MNQDIAGLMKRLILFFSFLAAATVNCTAQDIPGFPREDFGKVVLSTKQWAGRQLEASIGLYKNEPISNYDRRSIFFRLGGPVGRLDILTNIRVFPCTGFLIASNRLVTNYHCVPGILEVPEVRALGATRIEAVQFVLGYTQEGVDEPVRRYTVSPAPLEANKALDYAILEVFGEPGAAFGQLRITSAEPFENAPLWIIGHPLGEAQRISREQCKSGNPVLSGGRLLHTCDTLPGNSGSPVIDPDSREVIALHHAGSKRNSVNYAIPAAAIVEQSPILQELMKQDGEKLAVGITEPPPAAQPQPACDGVEVSLGTGGTQCVKPGSGESFRDCPECSGIVAVPAGEFRMGSPENEEGRDSAVGPQHKVTIPAPFGIGRTHVTRGEFAAFAAATGHKTEGGCYTWTGSEWKTDESKSWRDPGFSQDDAHPVVCVSAADAEAYISWLNGKVPGKPYRLPSEAEAEYSARGVRVATPQPRYFFGNDAKDLCNYANGADETLNERFSGWTVAPCRDGHVFTAPVASFRPNAFGLHDVHGNAWVWTADCWNESYKDKPEGLKADGGAWTSGNCSARVLRGGSWLSFPQYLRSASRFRVKPGYRIGSSGFRVARTLLPL